MLKWIGILFLAAACILFGQSMAQQMKERLLLLEQMEKYLILIKGDIRYGQMTLSQIISPLKETAAEPYQDFFQELVARMDSFDGNCLSRIWKETVEETLSKSALKKEDLELFCQISSFLGVKDAASQVAALEHQLTILNYHTNNIRRQMPGKVMVARTIGITSGMFLAVLLV
ncbi:MAG: stage III sporulation protein AB [Clostridiales bacterium]|nr:stage III sporulation protein AB [Clostridiales bacterium]